MRLPLKPANGSNNNLPKIPAAAVQRLIQISQALLAVAEKETQALLLTDMLAFSILQYEKEKLGGQYAAASAEFRSRVDEFKAVDKNLIARLEKLQKDLAQIMGGNNALVEQAREKAMFSARKGVRSMQDLGKRARMNDSQTSNEGAPT